MIISNLQSSLDPRRHIDPLSKELAYNPKYEELFAPVKGPEHPFKTGQQKAHKNTLSGYVEKAHMNEFNFENQRRTFHSYGRLLVIKFPNMRPKSIIKIFLVLIQFVVISILGYAVDPSVALNMGETNKVVGVAPDNASAGELKTVFESSKPRPKDKRKRLRNDNPDDIEGFLGPWGAFENQEHVSKPTEVSVVILLVILLRIIVFK